jgi:hypothetical protein
MADEPSNKEVRSINGCVMEWCIGGTRIFKSPMEKMHCSDYFVYDATNNSERKIGGRIKASLRVAEKLSWHLAEQEAKELEIRNEVEIEKIRDKILFKKFGIFVGLFARHGWLTTKQKVAGRMEQALRREGYLEGEWRGIEGEARFEIFVNYQDFAGTGYDPYVLLSGVLVGSHSSIEPRWIRNPPTGKWVKTGIVEDYSKYNGDAYFVSISENIGEIRNPISLEEVLEKRKALYLKNIGLCSFDVNYAYATPVKAD